MCENSNGKAEAPLADTFVNFRQVFNFAIAVLALAQAALARASDLAQEERWAEQIVEGLENRNASWLSAGDTEFLALYSPAVGRRRAGVLLLHDIGEHPDWRQVTKPLRDHLAARGFDALAIQMPLPTHGAPPSDYAPLYDEAVERIFAGLETLKGEGNKRIFLVGHGLGAGMAGYFLADADSPEVAGVALIGMSAAGTPEGFDASAAIAALKSPVLDVVGAAEREELLQSATARAVGAKANRRYVQKTIAGAGHGFEGREKELLQTVGAWLDRHAPPIKKAAPAKKR